MKISNRIKRNISLCLLILGLCCTMGRAWYVVMDPHSGKAWFELAAIILLTCCSLDSFRIYRRRVAHGILFGSE